MAKQTSSKSSPSAAKGKRTSEAPAPITKTILKADPVVASQDVIVKAEPTHEQIAQRAFELYQARSFYDGSALSDWLSAERELSSQSP